MAALDNTKQEAYAQNIVRGMTQRAAYLAAFPASKNWTQKTVDTRAWELSSNPDVAARIQELQSASASAAIMDRVERMETLTSIARDQKQMPKQRMQAIDILNKMDGDYVKRVEATVTTPVAETAAAVAAILNE